MAGLDHRMALSISCYFSISANGRSKWDLSGLLLYILALGTVGMFVRNFYHQVYWMKILGVIPAEVVHIPQYWSLFIIGIIAGRGIWLQNVPSSLGPIWIAIG